MSPEVFGRQSTDSGAWRWFREWAAAVVAVLGGRAAAVVAVLGGRAAAVVAVLGGRAAAVVL